MTKQSSSKHTKQATEKRTRPRKPLFKITEIPTKQKVDWNLLLYVIQTTDHYREFMAETVGVRPNQEDICNQAMMLFFNKDRLFVDYMTKQKAANHEPLDIISDSKLEQEVENLLDNMFESSSSNNASKVAAKSVPNSNQTSPPNRHTTNGFSSPERSRLPSSMLPKHEQQQKDLIP